MSVDKRINTILNPDDFQYQPVDYLLSNAAITEIPALYANVPVNFEDTTAPLLICLIGPSGSGKDSVIRPLLESGELGEALGATSRDRRVNMPNTPDEPEDKYVWLRPQREDESLEEYHRALIDEYQLVESSVNNGFVYGLPLSSLHAALQRSATVLVNDNFAYRQIREAVQGTANCLCVFVVPDSFEQLWGRVSMREKGEQRLRDAVRFIKDAPNVTHYYIHNSETSGGLEDAQRAIRHILQLHTTHES